MKIKKLAPAALFLFALTTAPAFAGDPSPPASGPARGKEVLVIKDSKDAQTFDAQDQDVTVNGSHNKVTIKGTCHALTVSGDANSVSVESVATISVAGDGNEITWMKVVEGTTAQVTNTGKANKISHSESKAQ